MRKLLLTLIVSAALIAAARVSADVSTTQHLPSAACNRGTMNAHESVPETTGSGKTVPAHEAIPGPGNVTPCGHGS